MQGLSQCKLAQKAGICPTSLSRIEAGKEQCGYVRTKRLAKALGCECFGFNLFKDIEDIKADTSLRDFIFKEITHCAFDEVQEERIREIVKEEMANFKIDSDCGALIVENRLNQLREKAERS